jgi:tetratricopeptide (TPR) repeat protein
VRKILWASLILLILAIAAVGAFILLRYLRPSPASGPSHPPSIARLEAQDVPPLPNLSLQINSAEELEVFQGTPLIFTVRVANQRAANAASTLRAHEAYLSLIQEKVAKGEISAAEAQPMLELARQKPEVKVVRLGTSDQGWETFLHFEVESAGAKPERLNWPMQMVTPPQSRSLTLNASSNWQLDYALTPEAAVKVPAGDYSIIAVLEVSAAPALPQDLWRGRVASQPVKFKISPTPAQPSAAEQASMNMQRAEFFSTLKDWSNALASALAALAADPKLIRAEMIVGEAKEAQGDLSGARDAFLDAKRHFDEQYPDSYEAPQYLIYKIATLDERLGKRRTESKP